MVVNKNIDINIDRYPISMAISIVPNIVDIEIEILLTPGASVHLLGHCISNLLEFLGLLCLQNVKYLFFSHPF